MDGPAIVTIVSSCVVVSSTIGVGFWRLGRAIGRLEGKVDGMDVRMDRLDKRVNGVFEHSDDKKE